MPLTGSAPIWQRRWLTISIGGLMLVIAALIGTIITGSEQTAFSDALRTWGTSAGYLLVAVAVALRVVTIRESRGPWLVIATGVSAYALGNVLWELWIGQMASPPFPSICDALWLTLYPTSYAGLVMLFRRQTSRVTATMWMDGLIVGLGLAAILATIVFPKVLETTTGTPAAVVTNFSYPIGDLVLCALVMGGFAIRGWRPSRALTLLGTGCLSLTVADSMYLLKVADGAYQSPTLANIFFLLGVGLIAAAAWQPTAPAERTGPRASLSTLLVPTAFVATSLGIVVFERVHAFGTMAFTLAGLTIVVGIARTIMGFRDLIALAEARELSITDDLTSLPNRRLFMSRLETTIATAQETQGSCALLLLDLDRFKDLNDTLGHAAGDDLLRHIGPRLRDALRTSDTLARLGGDEFGLVIPGPIDSHTATAVADKLRDALTEPFPIQGLRLHVDASIGIAVFPRHGDTAVELLRLADVALYQAKRGRTGFEVYDPARDTHSRVQLSLAADLKDGLNRGEVTAFFQPKADAFTGQIIGMEALARWQHPVHGSVSPATFVPVAEQNGLSRRLTSVVLEQALDSCAQWHAAGHEIHVAVNATAADLVDATFPDQIQGALTMRGLPPQALEIEITEYTILTNPARIEANLERIRAAGVKLALDDFGTGYSSLTHLRTLPINELKIDRSFVLNASTSAKDLSIVLAIVRMAETLGLRVVAEGVEDAATWRKLADIGCDVIQGYALSRPVEAEQAFELLRAPALQL